MQSLQLRAMKVGTYHFAQDPSPKYDKDAYLTTFFQGEACDLCWELGRAQKLGPTLNTSPTNISS